MAADGHTATPPTTLLVDIANVMGARPDGWWRDRAGAATRLLGELAALVGRQVEAPAGPPKPLGPVALDQTVPDQTVPGLTVPGLTVLGPVVAVLEGAARAATDPAVPGLVVHLARHDGDSRIVELAEDLAIAGGRLIVVTADRGLRARLPAAAAPAGPRWLLDLLDVVRRDRTDP